MTKEEGGDAERQGKKDEAFQGLFSHLKALASLNLSDPVVRLWMTCCGS